MMLKHKPWAILKFSLSLYCFPSLFYIDHTETGTLIVFYFFLPTLFSPKLPNIALESSDRKDKRQWGNDTHFQALVQKICIPATSLPLPQSFYPNVLISTSAFNPRGMLYNTQILDRMHIEFISGKLPLEVTETVTHRADTDRNRLQEVFCFSGFFVIM